MTDKPLSEKEHYGHSDIKPDEYIKWYPEEDVREAVQNFIIALDRNASEKRRIVEVGKVKYLIKLIFGSELTGGNAK